MKKLVLAALTSSSTPALADDVDAALALLAEHAVHAPVVDARDRARLARGEVVTQIAQEGVAGLVVAEASLQDVWSTVHDPAVTGDPAVHELRLSADEHGTELWFGRMGLPSPLSDRQWVVRSVVNRSIAEASGGRIWERAWTEVPDGLELARPALAAGHLPSVPAHALDDGIVTPVNRGGWLLVRLDEARTLVAYHARTDLGGSVPHWMVRDVARRQVGQLLGRVTGAVRAPHPRVVPGGPTGGD